MTITADGYNVRSFRYRINEGANAPRIKYDTGLWPSDFAADFHIFYDPGRPTRLYGLIGLANPLSGPIYVTSMYVETAGGETVQNLLDTYQDYQNFALVYAGSRLSLDPVPAVVIPSRGVIGHIELRPFSPPAAAAATPDVTTYRLVVTYADRAGYRDGNIKRAVKEVQPQAEEDLNPHSP